MMVASVTRMEIRSEVTEVILNITLEIIHLLTGEDCTVVKKTSGECVAPSRSGGWSRAQSPVTEPTTYSPINKTNKTQKILELTNRIIGLLTREVPIRCQDVAVYFSMEEWEYVEGHKDLYPDIMEDPRWGHHDSSHQAAAGFSNDSSRSQLGNKLEKDVSEGSCDDRSRRLITSYEPFDMKESVLCIGESVIDTSVHSPTDDTGQHLSTRTMEGLVMGDGENFTETDIYTQHDLVTHIMEEPPSCDEDLTEPNIYTSTDHNRYHPTTHIMEEPPSCDEDLTEPNIYTSTDHTLLQPTTHIIEEPLSCDEDPSEPTNYTYTDHILLHPTTHDMEELPSCDEDLTEPNIYMNKNHTQLHPTTHIKEEPLSCDEDLTESKTYTPMDHVPYISPHIKEEPLSCNEDFTEPNIYMSTDHTQLHDTSHIKEEPLSCDEGLTETNTYTPMDHVPYISPHIKEEPLSSDEGLTETNTYTPMDNVQYISPHIKEEPLSCDEDLEEPNSFNTPMDRIQYLSSHIKEEPLSCDDPNRYTPAGPSQHHQCPQVKKEPDCDNGGQIPHTDIYTPWEHDQYPSPHIKEEPVSYDGGNISYATQYPTTSVKEEPGSPVASDHTGPIIYTHNHSGNIKEEPMSGHGSPKYQEPMANQSEYLKTNLYTARDCRQNVLSTCVKTESSGQHSPTLGLNNIKTENPSSPVKVIVLAHLVDVNNAKAGNTSLKGDQSQGQRCDATTSRHGYHHVKGVRSVTRAHPGSIKTSESKPTFGDISNLTKYLRTHSKKKTPQCPECGQYFLRKGQLDAHLQNHAKQRSPPSSGCSKFHSSNVPMLERKTSPRETLHQCSLCGKSFTNVPDLLSHEKNHKGEKPFQCPECGKCFSIYYDLFVHKKTHRKESPERGVGPPECPSQS